MVKADYTLLKKYNLFEKFRQYPKFFYHSDTKQWSFATKDLNSLVDLFKTLEIEVSIENNQIKEVQPIELKLVDGTVFIKQFTFDTNLYNKLKTINGYKWEKVNRLHTIPDQYKWDLLKMLKEESIKYIWSNDDFAMSCNQQHKKIKLAERTDDDEEKDASELVFCSPITKVITTPTQNDSKNVYKKRSILNKNKTITARKLNFA